VPAPVESLTPLVGWLDDDRILVISQGTQNISQLVAVNVSKGNTQTVKQLSGVRWFGLSQDRATVVAATESAVYLGPVADWLAGKQPAKILDLGETQVIWNLVLDQTGTRLAMLSGTEAEDGTVSQIHELGYVPAGTAWVKTYDQAVPFTRCLGQAWAG
jgi:hypothetical protein